MAGPGFIEDEVDAFLKNEKIKRSDYSLTHVGDLLKEPSPEFKWLVKDLLMVGGFSLMCGKPKSGKSTLSRCLALTIVKGKTFLGRETNSGKVIMFCLEDQRFMLKESFLQLGATGDENLFIHCGNIAGTSIIHLKHAIEKYQPALVIIDTVFRFVKCFDTNSYTDVISALTPLSDLARSTGVHIMALHHMSKTQRQDSADGILGSVGIHGSVDATLLLKRSPASRVIESQQRYGIDIQPTTLTFDSETGWIEVGLPVAEVETERLSNDIVEYLSFQDGSVTEQEISSAIGGKTETKRRALRTLVEGGKILREGRGGRGEAFRYSIC